MNAAQKPATAWTTPSTLFTLIDRANEQGDISFVVPANSPVALPGDEHRWLLWQFWFDLPLAALKLEADKEAATAEIGFELTKTDDGIRVSFNLARLLHLPGIAPAQELAEFRSLLLEMKAFLSAHPTEHCQVQFYTGKGKAGKDRPDDMFGTPSCRVPSTAKYRFRTDKKATRAIAAHIQASEALSFWLTKVVESLHKVSPSHAAVIREDVLFGRDCGPYAQHKRALAELDA